MAIVRPETGELIRDALAVPVVRGHLSVSVSLKRALLFAADLLLLNLALILALTVRQLAFPAPDMLTRNLIAFNVFHGVWLLIFYSVGLYDVERFTIPGALGRKVVQGAGISGLVTAVLLYAFSFPKLQPKTILLLHLGLSALLLLGSRSLYIRWSRKGATRKILLCGKESEIHQLQEFVDQNGYLGYEISPPLVLWEGEQMPLGSRILERLRGRPVDILAITRSLSEEASVRGFFYQLLCAGVHVIPVSHLFEELTGKIPISAINEGWLIENLREFNKRGFELFQRLLDLMAAVVLGIGTLLLFPVIALAIKLESRGPILFRQTRVGKGGRNFEVVKFRTMVRDAEPNGAQWTQDRDPRITAVGSFLRRTRLDELPQSWNVLRGEMSLVGPRPERPEFVKELSEKIPFYEARQLVKPGLTGWAQINFRYGASTEDAMEKLQHDLYYIKNRSLTLELSILVKTVATVLRYEGR